MPRRDEPPKEDAALDAIARAFVHIRRSQTRRTFGHEAAKRSRSPVPFALVAVLDAIDEGPDEGASGVAVGDVAARLGIAPSRASRAVAEAVSAGLVERALSSSDSRRIELALTARGREVVKRAHATRRAMLGELLDDFSAKDRGELARLLSRLVERMVERRRGR